jgi:predicted dehydrogenase
MGPVIEQGTHFCDLSRYFGGNVDIASVVAHSVEFDEAPGQLSAIPIDEAAIPEDQRIPRITAAVWKYANGAVGSFTHTVALQGTLYDCELEVWADGYHMRLIDPYNAPQLLVRRPGDDHNERHQFTDDDPFFSEMSAFIDSVEGKPDSHILSSFEDATKTYELTWAIRLASEKSAAARKAAAKA